MRRLTYKQAGVDIKIGDDFIKKRGLSAFGALFDFLPLIRRYKKPFLVASADGVGTKLKLAQKFNKPVGVGVDLVAMGVNDVICLGAKPLFFLDYIACGRINNTILKKVIKGIKLALKKSDCILLGGETAQMPGMYKKDEYDLAGFCVGVVERDKIIDGSKIEKGDLILGVSSSGVHSNGFSLIRKVFSLGEIKKYLPQLLKPTRIYVKPILSLLSNFSSPFSIKGIAHITGGAFYYKATKLLPSGLGMVVYKSSWRVPEIFRIIQEKGNISEREMYSVFNMGIGLIMIVNKEKEKRIRSYLNRFYPTFRIGEIVKSEKKIRLER